MAPILPTAMNHVHSSSIPARSSRPDSLHSEQFSEQDGRNSSNEDRDSIRSQLRGMGVDEAVEDEQDRDALEGDTLGRSTTNGFSSRPTPPNLNISDLHPPFDDSQNITGASVGSKYAPRLRAAVKRLEAVRHVSSKSSTFNWASSAAGMEPGVDANEVTEYPGMDASAKVHAVDYSATHCIIREFDEVEFLEWIEGEKKPEWSAARWINVSGLNWPVIRKLALKYGLHPLALEDALSYSSHSHSKADWYSDQLFVRLLLHELCPPEVQPSYQHSKVNPVKKFFEYLGFGQGATLAALSGSGALDEEDNVGGFKRKSVKDVKSDAEDDGEEDANGGVLDQDLTARDVVIGLTKQYRVAIERQLLSVFLLPSGDILTFFSADGSKICRSIFERLSTPNTMLRRTEDPSMLLQAILDSAVDQCLVVVEEFRKQLDILEGRALVKPGTGAVRHLHVMSSQLTMLKRTLTPLQALIMNLRHHDDERTLLARQSATYDEDGQEIDAPTAPKSKSGPGKTYNRWQKGYLSRDCKVYLADVQDHIDSCLSSLEMFASMASGIVDFIFNSLSFSSNESMKWLTFITIIFLPLGFLTGYFGMNFQIFPEIGVFPTGVDPSGGNQSGSISFFWKITGPVIAVLVFIILFGQLAPQMASLGRSVIHTRLTRGLRRNSHSQPRSASRHGVSMRRRKTRL